MGARRITAILVALALALSLATFFLSLELRDDRGSLRGVPPSFERTLSVSASDVETDRPSSGRPYYDLVIVILVKGSGTPGGAEELDRARRLYARYVGTLSLGGGEIGLFAGRRVRDWTFRYVFVVDNTTTGVGPVPQDGLLDGDMYHVDAPSGFEHISDKTLALMSLAAHFDFRFLAKTDSDTFPCLRRLATAVEAAAPPAKQPRLYAGLLNRCGTVFAKGKRLHDAPFVEATGGVLSCHPMYHQGAFYVLGRGLVEHLYRSRNDLQLMFNEDAMVGLWLLGVRRTIADIGGAFNCRCHNRPPDPEGTLPLPFYHSCKRPEQIQTCEDRLGLC